MKIIENISILKSLTLSTLLTIPMVLAVSTPALGQSLFSTGDTKSSLTLKDSSIIQLEVPKEKFRLAYVKAPLVKGGADGHLRGLSRYGFDISATGTSDNRTVFTTKNQGLSGQFSFMVGKSYLASYSPSNNEVTLQDNLLIAITENLTTLAKVVAKNAASISQLRVTADDQLKTIDPKIVKDLNTYVKDGTLEDESSSSPSYLEFLLKYKKLTATEVALLKEIVAPIKAIIDKTRSTNTLIKLKKDDIALAKAQIDRVFGSEEKEYYFVLAETLEKGKSEKLPVVLSRLSKLGSHHGIWFDNLDLNFSVGSNKYKILDTSKASLKDQIATKNFNQWSASLTYNAELGVNREGDRIFGISIGADRVNNIGDDFEQVDLRDSTIQTPVGGVTRDSSTTQKVYKPTGTMGFTVRTIGTLNMDYMVLPNGFSRRLGVDFFLRHQFASQNTKSRPGIGFFLLEKGSPRKINGGISFTPDKKNDVAANLFVGRNF